MPFACRRHLFEAFLGVSCALVMPLSLLGCADEDDPIAPPSIAWEPCEDIASLDCGKLAVPLDPQKPYGAKMKLAVVRATALDPAKRIGSLVLNPGGPGGSGVSLAKIASFTLAPALRDRFDIVGFDPRGEARSTPAIDCASELDLFVALDTTPDTEEERQALIDQSQALADGCEQHAGSLLPLVGTNNIVADMDLLREALGDEKLTYLGFSYGTFLGAIYADTYPEHVRALVLDGALDPAVTTEGMIEGQALAFEGELLSFFDWCDADEECGKLFEGNTTAAYDSLQAAVETAPLTVSNSERTVGPGEFSYGVSAALYQPRNWPSLAQALALAKTGDGIDLLNLADGYTGRRPDGSFDNGLDVYYAVTSIDTTSTRSPAAIASLADRVQKKAPRIGAYLPYSALPSALWPVAPWRSAGPVTAKGAPPILVIGGTRDPATPLVWAEALADQLPKASLLTRDGDGHTSFLRGNKCIDENVIAYLVNLALPPPGTVCED